MALTPSQQLGSIKNQMDDMPNEALCAIIDHAKEVMDKRKFRHQKELWGNVVAAIAKYEKEIEPITFYCRQCGEDSSIDVNVDTPGTITIS